MPIRLLLLLLLSSLAAAASAQEPTGPPPPPGDGTLSSELELLPDIGRIGAQAALFVGPSINPYDTGDGVEVGGYLDLPLRRAPGGKLSYEIFVGLSLATSDPFTITDPVAVLANLASGSELGDALAGPPRAPFPVTRSVRTRLRLLQLSPVGFKYTITRFDHVRLRPYLAVGLDFLAVFTQEKPERDESPPPFTGSSPFDAALIGGLVAQAPELTARGRPTGQGNVELGGHAAAGLELRVASGLSLNLEYRFTASEGDDGRMHAGLAAVGLHW